MGITITSGLALASTPPATRAHSTRAAPRSRCAARGSTLPTRARTQRWRHASASTARWSRNFRRAPARSRPTSRSETASSVVFLSEHSWSRPRTTAARSSPRSTPSIRGARCSRFPAPSTIRSRAGVIKLIREGAKLVESAADVLSEVPNFLQPHHLRTCRQPCGSGRKPAGVGQGLRNPVRCARLRTRRH